MWHPIKRFIEKHADDPQLEERLQRIYQLVAQVALADYVMGQRETLIITERAIAQAAERMSIAEAAQTIGGPQFYYGDGQDTTLEDDGMEDEDEWEDEDDEEGGAQ